MMKLWKFTRTDRIDWDEYIGFVVLAETPEDAVKLIRESIGYDFDYEFDVKEVDMTKRHFLLSSYNAG
jgi:hypothetical protein